MITLVSASVENIDATKVILTFNKELDEYSIPDVSAFTLVGKTITDVVVSGVTVTLTVSVKYIYGDEITVDYTVPETNWIKVPAYMYNKITGSTDYITRAGVVGARIYKVPNTTPYRNADIGDYVWFDPSSTNRGALTADLIGYDFEKTFIYYDDDSPNTIREIIILKSGETLTTDEMNIIRDNLRLSIWWDDTLSEYGFVKSNRDMWRNVFAFSIIGDGNTLGWYDAQILSTITKGAYSNGVTEFRNLLGTGKDFLSYSPPIWSIDGITFSSERSLYTASFTNVPQPITIYMVAKALSWSANAKFFDGGTIGELYIFQTTATPVIAISALGVSLDNNAFTLNKWKILRGVFHENESTFAINTTYSYSVNSIGTNGLTGFTLGKHGGITWSGFANYTLKELIVRSSADTLLESDEVYRYLAEKYPEIND